MANCPYCVGDVAVEVLGIWVHKLPSRWISCNLRNQENREEIPCEHESSMPPYLHELYDLQHT